MLNTNKILKVEHSIPTHLSFLAGEIIVNNLDNKEINWD